MIKTIKYTIYNIASTIQLNCSVIALMHFYYLFDLPGVLPDFTLTFNFALGRSEFTGVALDVGLRLEEVEVLAASFDSVFLFLVDTFPSFWIFLAVEA